MPVDPATMAALASLFGTAMGGGKQLGGMAHPFQPGGGMGGVAGGLFQDPISQMAAMTNPSGLNLLNSLSQPQAAGTTATEVGLPAEPPGPPISPSQREAALESSKPPGFFDSFFGSIDQNLQSPAKLLGIGLLNQMGYPLGTAGLLGKGLFDAIRR